MRKLVDVQEIRSQSRDLEEVLIDTFSLVSLDTHASRWTYLLQDRLKLISPTY